MLILMLVLTSYSVLTTSFALCQQTPMRKSTEDEQQEVEEGFAHRSPKRFPVLGTGCWGSFCFSAGLSLKLGLGFAIEDYEVKLCSLEHWD